MRVRIPTPVKKGRPKFCSPCTVLGQKGQNTYIFDDDKVWNAILLSPCPGQNCLDNEPTEVLKPVVSPVAQRQSRIKRPPVWHKDFVMNCTHMHTHHYHKVVNIQMLHVDVE